MRKPGFSKITNEEKNALVDIFFGKLKEDRNDIPDSAGRYTYTIELQDDIFTSLHTDDEVKKLIALAVDVVEELRKINHNKYNRATLDVLIHEQHEKEKDKFAADLMTYDIFMNEKLLQIINDICEVCNADGIFKLMYVTPFLKAAIFNVFDFAVDSFSDEDIYLKSVYFILRSEMKIAARPVE